MMLLLAFALLLPLCLSQMSELALQRQRTRSDYSISAILVARRRV